MKSGIRTDPRKAKYYKLPRYFRAVAYFCIRYFLKLGFLDGVAGFRWHFSALAYARRVRFPTGREPPQGAVTAGAVVSVDCGSGDRKDESEPWNTRKRNR